MNDKYPGCDVLLTGYEDHENLGLRYVAAYLGVHGVRAGIEPMTRYSNDPLIERIKRDTPKIVGFSLIFQGMFTQFKDLIIRLRDEGIQAHFTMGGHFPTIDYETTLTLMPGLDTVVRHEGEETLLELYEKIDRPDLWPQIKGLAWRRDGEIAASEPRPLIENLDLLPFPVRDAGMKAHMGMPAASILSSRGCNFDCSFCSIRRFYGSAPGPLRRSRSARNVADEMEALYENGARIFDFKDDDFGMRGRSRSRWIEDFARELERRSLTEDIILKVSCRIDEIESEALQRMKEIGLGMVYLGIESGSEDGLKSFNKHYGVGEIRETLQILQANRMGFEYGFMILEPSSSFDSIRENISFLQELCKGGRVIAHFARTYPYVGTTVAARLKGEGRLKGTIDYPDYSYLDGRIDLFERFLNRAFGRFLFETQGLVNQVQNSFWNALLLQRFSGDSYDVEGYTKYLMMLTDRCNKSTLLALSGAVGYMEERSKVEILRDWLEMELVIQGELEAQSRIEKQLDLLNSTYHTMPEFWKGI
jgi:radical SAM superfamily enzyme YgiQ (UPF0313 family)